MYYYLIINEGLSNGLIKSQVIDPIIYNGLNEQVGIISLERIGKKINRPKDVLTKVFSIAIPYRLFMFNFLSFLTPFFAFTYALFLSFITKKGDVMIARSYFPGLVAYSLKTIKGVHYIFDPRSLFIHESVTKGNLVEGSTNFKRWQTWEQKILKNAKKINVVAEAQDEYYRDICDNVLLDIVNIPCYCTNDEFMYDKDKLLPFKDTDIVIAYYGSLDKGWNNIDVYAEFFNKLIKSGYKVCIVSQNFSALKVDKRFQREEIFIVDTQKNKNHQAYLQVCDYGVIIMPKVLDWKTRLSVKFSEYLNNGLGILVGEYVGEAARLAKIHFSRFCKIIGDENNVDDLKKIENEDRVKIKAAAQDLFGMQNFLKLFDK